MARLAAELGQELIVIDARDMGLKDLPRVQEQVRNLTNRSKRCVVVLRLVSENATTVPLAQGLDAALLGVFIGETTSVGATRSIEEVGRSKFLGSIVISPKR
jgi:hypothetical protein